MRRLRAGDTAAYAMISRNRPMCACHKAFCNLPRLHGATSHQRCAVDKQIVPPRLQKTLWQAHIGLLREIIA